MWIAHRNRGNDDAKLTWRDVIIVSLIIALIVLCIVLIFALPMKAQQFGADQVRLLSAIHITSPWSSFASDVWITNRTTDSVSVSVTYGAANGAPNLTNFLDVIKLAPGQQCEFIDFLGAATSPSPNCKLIGAPLATSGFGQLMFNACLDGADCRDGAANAAQNYRNISVMSRIYSFTSAGGPTVGQNFSAVPWWSYGDAYYPVTIAGVRNLKDVWHTNIGIVNASDTQPVTITATLYDGASHGQRDQVTFDLPPFGARQQGATDLFPLFGEWVRQNPTRLAANAYITVTSSKAGDGFYAYGSLIDSRSGSATTLEATSDYAPNDERINVLFGAGQPAPAINSTAFKTAAAVATPRAQRIVNFLNFHYAGTNCSVEPGKVSGVYVIRKPNGQEWLHVGLTELDTARTFCGAATNGKENQ